MAKIIRISHSSLAEMEKGTAKIPRVNTLLELIRVLDVSPDWFLRGEGDVPTFLSAENSQSELLSAFKALNADNKSLLIALVQTMLAHQQTSESESTE